MQDSSVDPLVDAEALVAKLGLTPSEADVVVRLATGNTVREIASQRNRSVDSVRWHLKQVFAKTGVRSQADLVRVVLTESLAGPTP